MKIAIFLGGEGSEHEISLISGEEVFKALKKGRPTKIYISRNNQFFKDKFFKNKIKNIFDYLQKFDFIFIALHGASGENGQIQEILEFLKIKYSGSNSLTSAICMDKVIFKKLLEKKYKNHFPKYINIHKKQKIETSKIEKYFNSKSIIIKPNNQGSSVGVSKIDNYNDLKNAIDKAFEFSDQIIIEEYIKGKELTCAVLGNKNPQALPIIEIIPNSNFFDYKSKYQPNGATEICPAQINKNISNKIQNLALDIYKDLNCTAFSRIDFILEDKSKNIFILENNTIPGLTPMSLFPKAAKAVNISFENLIKKIIFYSNENN